MTNELRTSYGGSFILENDRVQYGVKEIELPSFEREVMEDEDISSDAVIPIAGRLDVVEMTVTFSDDYPEALDAYRFQKTPFPFKVLTSSERRTGSGIAEDSIAHICRGFVSESEGGTISQSERPEPEFTIVLTYYQKLVNGVETQLFDVLAGGLTKSSGLAIGSTRRTNLGFSI